MYAMANAALLSGEGRFQEAAAAAREARSTVNVLGAASQPVKHGYVEGLEAALTMGDFGEVDTLVAEIEAMKPGGRPPFLSAQAARFRARLAATQGERDGVEQGFKTAEQIFREYGIPFCLAVTQLEHGDWLGAQGGSEDVGPLFAEGREIFERLEAKPWLERLEAAKATHGAEVPA
jgi:ATP/maltotriose-dependent transcriptional regulator MalT